MDEYDWEDAWDAEVERDRERYHLRLMADPTCGTPDHPGCPGCEDWDE
jgi:hypothetical protein